MRWPFRRGREPSLEVSLREFVYLDEVSVYSLLASRDDGFVELGKTLSESVTKKGRLGGGIRGSTGLVQAELSSHLESSEASGTQVVKKSIIQTAFKQLIEREASRLILAESWLPAKLPKVSDVRGLEEAADGQFVVRQDQLRRGSLLELEVELDTEGIFQASRLVTTMWGFFERIPQFFPLDASSRSMGSQIQELFDQLLHDLVPIEARITNYQLVHTGAGSFLVSNQLLESERWQLDTDTEAAYLVGIAEEALFWRDLRRVLFSRSRYQVMARLGHDGIQDAWQPVKVVEMLSRVLPQIDSQMRELGSTFLGAVRHGAGTVDGGSNEPQNRKLETFADRLADSIGSTWSEEDSRTVELDFLSDPDTDDPRAQREAAQPIVDHLANSRGETIDRKLVSDLRAEAFMESDDTGGLAPAAGDRSKPARRYLDCEIVAIYW
jgi:hypothetical protein